MLSGRSSRCFSPAKRKSSVCSWTRKNRRRRKTRPAAASNHADSSVKKPLFCGRGIILPHRFQEILQLFEVGSRGVLVVAVPRFVQSGCEDADEFAVLLKRPELILRQPLRMSGQSRDQVTDGEGMMMQ